MGMLADELNSSVEGGFEILLDGQPVFLPSDRRSLPAIRSYLDMLALEHHRILCSLSIDGEPIGLGDSQRRSQPFARVEGETIDLEEMPLQLIRTALQQTDQARARVHSAVVLVLINDCSVARECWWDLATHLKEPLVTLSLLPDTACGPVNGGASLTQLRRWQLEQLGNVLKTVDDACWSEDPGVLSNALESGALPWLNDLRDMLALWYETALAASRLADRRA